MMTNKMKEKIKEVDQLWDRVHGLMDNMIKREKRSLKELRTLKKNKKGLDMADKDVLIFLGKLESRSFFKDHDQKKCEALIKTLKRKYPDGRKKNERR